MSAVHLGKLEVISLRLSLPLSGVWTAEVEVDGNAVPLGSTSLAFGVAKGEPITFAGTILEGGAFEGRGRAFLVGGAGGLRRKLPPRQYQIVPPRLLVAAIVREAGELAGELSGLDGLPPLPRWVRSAGTGAAALSVLCRRLGLGWRLGRDGAVFAGPERWPAFKGRALVLEEDRASGRALLALDAPEIEAGMLLEGRKVGRVVHVVKEGGEFRTLVHFEGAS